MPLVTATCTCGNTWQSFQPDGRWDRLQQLAHCPDCANRALPWNHDIDRRHLVAQPGWRKVSLGKRAG